MSFVLQHPQKGDIGEELNPCFMWTLLLFILLLRVSLHSTAPMGSRHMMCGSVTRVRSDRARGAKQAILCFPSISMQAKLERATLRRHRKAGRTTHHRLACGRKQRCAPIQLIRSRGHPQTEIQTPARARRASWHVCVITHACAHSCLDG